MMSVNINENPEFAARVKEPRKQYVQNEGMRFTRDKQNTCSFGKFLAGRSETCWNVPFLKSEIPCILLFLNRNKNSQNSPVKEFILNYTSYFQTKLTINNIDNYFFSKYKRLTEYLI